MIKLTFCLRRLPSLSPEEFYDYWLHKHGPLVRRHRGALRIKRYLQLHRGFDEIGARTRRARDAPAPFDGVAELWWTSLDDMTAAFASPQGRAAGGELIADERKFIDLANSPLWFGEEHVIFD